jgi:hypothetical protein
VGLLRGVAEADHVGLSAIYVKSAVGAGDPPRIRGSGSKRSGRDGRGWTRLSQEKRSAGYEGPAGNRDVAEAGTLLVPYTAGWSFSIDVDSQADAAADHNIASHAHITPYHCKLCAADRKTVGGQSERAGHGVASLLHVTGVGVGSIQVDDRSRGRRGNRKEPIAVADRGNGAGAGSGKSLSPGKCDHACAVDGEPAYIDVSRVIYGHAVGVTGVEIQAKLVAAVGAAIAGTLRTNTFAGISHRAKKQQIGGIGAAIPECAVVAVAGIDIHAIGGGNLRTREGLPAAKVMIPLLAASVTVLVASGLPLPSFPAMNWKPPIA